MRHLIAYDAIYQEFKKHMKPKQIHGSPVLIADKSAPEQRDEQIQKLVIDLANRLQHELSEMREDKRDLIKISLSNLLRELGYVICDVRLYALEKHFNTEKK